MRKIGLAIPVVNNFEGLKTLLEGINEPIGMVYVQPNWVENLGVSKAWNNGIRACLASGCTHVFVGNDDIILSTGALNVLADRLDRNDDCVLATGRNATKDPGWNPSTLCSFKGDNEGENPDYSCFMVTERYINTIGWFDENFTPAYFEDNDSHYRIRLAGLKAFNIGMAPMSHVGSASRRKPIANVGHDQFARNKNYYEAKWGGGPGREIYKNPFNDLNRGLGVWYPGEKK